MHTVEALGQLLVKFNDDVLGQFGVSRDVAQAATEQYLAGGGDVGSLDDTPVNTAIKAIAHFLSHLGKVTIKVVTVMGVDTLAQVGNVLIRRAHIDGVGTTQRSVGMIRGGCTGEDVNLKRTAGFVFGHGTGRKGLGDKFGRSGGGEA